MLPILVAAMADIAHPAPIASIVPTELAKAAVSK
jgi:hypothetical protein